MAVLFISHSSKDDTLATAVEVWLKANGFTDVFVDHGSIAGGDKWRDELRRAANACRVVVCLTTGSWLASTECYNEFMAAWYLGRRIIPLLLLPETGTLSEEARQRLERLLGEDQGIDLTPCLDQHGELNLAKDESVARLLNTGLRAAGANTRIGLDPEAFAIDRKLRPMPFPGLASFGDDDADAALFYGRSREIADILIDLRQIRAERDLRPYVILGASGAGKSSLLKAGIIPRLRREAPAWLPLRAFRPGADPLLNFAEAIARTLADFDQREAHGLIRDRLLDVWSRAERQGEKHMSASGYLTIEAALEAEGERLRSAANRPDATILVSIDQAEEMARADGGEALADYLCAALSAATNSWQLAFAIRTDSFSELQSHRRFQDLRARCYDLRALPVFRFDSVVEEPAKRYGVEVDSALVDALMEDAAKEDALPLLAFALQRLWRQYAASRALTRSNYDKVGGLRGLIEDASERALRGLAPEEDVPLPSSPPPKRWVDLGASTFVPALAQINDQGAIVRRLAAWNSFNDEQQKLLTRFDQWRLIREGSDADGGTVEVAHEALFREWHRLKQWLEPERARLEALRSLQMAAATWGRHEMNPGFLDHRGSRLSDATALGRIELYRKRLSTLEVDYLAACRAAERVAKSRTQRVQVLIYALFAGIIAGLVGWINQSYLGQQRNWFVTMRPYMLTNVRPYVLTSEKERALQPLASFRECAKDCPEMVVIPAGEFMMGSAVTEKGRYDIEDPQHKVTIARPFAVSKFDVTFANWDACFSVGGCPRASDSGYGREAKPVINVNWDDARQYVAWLSKMTGKSYRLLTEAEWEYAARAGSTTGYYWGDEIGKKNANCIGCGSDWDGRQTSPVGSFRPNAFGLYDMAGNVWQWVEDCYHASYKGSPVDGSAWNEGDCFHHIVRGGSWDDSLRNARPANRNGVAADDRSNFLGFRIGRTLAP
jgi:formylglycine-generating enzyme required for sulfatase activity